MKEGNKAVKTHIALTKYRTMVKRLQAPILIPGLQTREDVTIHAVLGMGDEAGELISILKRHLVYGEEYDPEHILEELGDMYHYMEYLMIEYNWTINDIMKANTDKLAKRYPEGFNTEDAVKRRDKQPGSCLETEAVRNIIETGIQEGRETGYVPTMEDYSAMHQLCRTLESLAKTAKDGTGESRVSKSEVGLRAFVQRLARHYEDGDLISHEDIAKQARCLLSNSSIPLQGDPT